MSKQYHYVVFYDEESKKWSVDYDVILNYDEGHIWDESANEWSAEYEDIDDVWVGQLKDKLAQKVSA